MERGVVGEPMVNPKPYPKTGQDVWSSGGVGVLKIDGLSRSLVLVQETGSQNSRSPFGDTPVEGIARPERLLANYHEDKEDSK